MSSVGRRIKKRAWIREAGSRGAMESQKMEAEQQERREQQRLEALRLAEAERAAWQAREDHVRKHGPRMATVHGEWDANGTTIRSLANPDAIRSPQPSFARAPALAKLAMLSALLASSGGTRR